MANKRIAPPDLVTFEAAYVAVRLLMAGVLIELFFVRVLEPVPGTRPLLAVGLGIFAATGIAMLVAHLVFKMPTKKVLWGALPLDLVASALLLAVTHNYQDPLYAWFVAMCVVYSLELERVEARVVSALLALTYVGSHYVASHGMHTPGDLALLFFKSIALMPLSYYVSEGMFRQLEREEELEESRDDIAYLNEMLQQRLSELNAVSEITEVMHSSLDFDEIAPIVLDIIRRVVNIPACTILVLDKEKGETIFSATGGLEAPVASDETIDALLEPGERGPVTEEGAYSCLAILDHAQMMVVFCAETDRIEKMRAEDRIVLQAVASELAVAVENAQLYRLTKRLAITDELTGLYNYRYLQQRLDDEFGRAQRYGRPLSLLMLDADEFKNFNDAYGHLAGDKALAELAGLLRGSIREIDVAVRYGGEEFSVVLPETDASGAFVVAEKIREEISSHLFLDDEGRRRVRLTVSVGLATFPSHAGDREELLRQADDALYRAKRGGRNIVRAAAVEIRAVEDGTLRDAGSGVGGEPEAEERRA